MKKWTVWLAFALALSGFNLFASLLVPTPARAEDGANEDSEFDSLDDTASSGWKESKPKSEETKNKDKKKIAKDKKDSKKKKPKSL
jgi:hypothetical protein